MGPVRALCTAPGEVALLEELLKQAKQREVAAEKEAEVVAGGRDPNSLFQIQTFNAIRHRAPHAHRLPRDR